MEDQVKAPDKIQLSSKEKAILSDSQFKTLIMGKLTEFIEYGHKLEEKVKAMKTEIKENVQETNSDEKKTGTQINNLDQKEERKIQPEQNEETRIQKKKRGEAEEPLGQL